MYTTLSNVSSQSIKIIFDYTLPGQKYWPPLLAIHALTLLGILLIKFIKTLLGIWLHSSCNAVSGSLTFLGKIERFLQITDFHFRIDQSFLSIHQFRQFSLCRSVSKCRNARKKFNLV